MGQDVTNQTRFCQIPQGSKKDMNRHLKSKRIFMAVGLTLILATTGLVVLQPPPAIPPLPPPLPPPLLIPLQLTPHGPLEIDGDANFSATALLEGWLGDGSPENPYKIDGLYIDPGSIYNSCIVISNTRVSFTISNCNLTGNLNLANYVLVGFNAGGVGICLENVTNGELVNNICNNNSFGISLVRSHSNTVANNTCNNNIVGIYISISNRSIVTGNTCNNNSGGIGLSHSDHSIVTDNTCNNNLDYGISIFYSDLNMVVNNTCIGNTEHDIYHYDSYSNTVADNITTPLPWKLIAVGGGAAIVVIVLAILFLRRR